MKHVDLWQKATINASTRTISGGNVKGDHAARALHVICQAFLDLRLSDNGSGIAVEKFYHVLLHLITPLLPAGPNTTNYFLVTNVWMNTMEDFPDRVPYPSGLRPT